MSDKNQAAYLAAKSARPLQVQQAPVTSPGPNEVLIRNKAVAINPVDWAKQLAGDFVFSYIRYPFVLGSDVAGEVVEVGKSVKCVQVGDRVLGHAAGMDKRVNRAAEGAFQQYTILRANLISKLPDDISYDQACVLPLGLSTAACALFMPDYLALPPRSVAPKPTGQVLLVWAGSSSVGSNAIQLAKAAGYEVLATASSKNFEYVRSLGASQVFDYHRPTVVSEIIQAIKNKTCAGAIAINDSSMEACLDIVAASKGRKFVAQVSVPLDPSQMPSNLLGIVSTMMGFLWWNLSMWFKAKCNRVATKFVYGGDLLANDVGAMVYTDFLPTALAQAKFRPAPEPLVVGMGLDKIQEAMDVNMKGLSAKKAVVSL